jgi:flagellar motor switch protein FliN/FliY
MAQLERVKVEIAVELGKTQFVLEDLLKLKPAADVDLNDPEMTAEERNQYVVKLDTQIGEPVDVLINDRVFAQGEVVSTNVGQPYGVRIISILNEEQQVAAQSERK